MYTLVLPITLQLTKKTSFTINLNDYRNAHYHQLNNAKIQFGNQLKRQVLSLPKMQAAELTYKLYLSGAGKKGDVSNFCSIADKFFSDVLVDNTRLPEDNYEHISDVHYSFGGIDKDNPRVEVTILPIGNLLPESEDDQMQIILTESEIKQALEEFVFKSMNINEDKAIDIDIRATRGADGTTAVIDIVEREGQTEEPVKETKPVTTSKRKPGPKPKVEPEPETPAKEEEKQPSFEEDSEEPEVPDASDQVDEPVSDEPEKKEETSDAPETVQPKKTLFGGLTKPTNSPS